MLFRKKFDINKIRNDFQILDKDLIYFDSACMSLKPIQVINKIKEYYEEYPACAGRSSHFLSQKLEEELLNARREVAKFINARSEKEIIFTRNTTEGINLLANSFDLKEGDEIIISDKEHNSNLIPWLKLSKEKEVKIVVCDSEADNTFSMENFKNCFSQRTKLVSMVHVSNLDGVENPIGEIIRISHEKGALVLVDAAQSVPHKRIDVKKLDVDFLVFSGHKMVGPSGTGVFYGKENLLENLNQFIVGGETVMNSSYDSYKEEELPYKFEAGLQDYAGIVGLGQACKYLRKIGLENVEDHEKKLNKILTEKLAGEEKIELIGPQDSEKRSAIFSFNIKGMDPHNVSKILSTGSKIITRSGAHCVHSWFNKNKLNGSVRVSLYFYNTEEEVNIFVDKIKEIISLL